MDISTRQEKRALNRTISKLTDPLVPMPLPSTKADTSNLESHVPTTGLEIRDLDGVYILNLLVIQ